MFFNNHYKHRAVAAAHSVAQAVVVCCLFPLVSTQYVVPVGSLFVIFIVEQAQKALPSALIALEIVPPLEVTPAAGFV